MLQSARKIYRPSPRCGVGTGKLRTMFQTVQDDQEPCIRCDERAPQQLSELALCTSSQGFIRLAGEDSNKQRWCIIPVDGGDDNLCYPPPLNICYIIQTRCAPQQQQNQTSKTRRMSRNHRFTPRFQGPYGGVRSAGCTPVPVPTMIRALASTIVFYVPIYTLCMHASI